MLAQSLNAWQQLAPCTVVLFAAELQGVHVIVFHTRIGKLTSEQKLSLVLLGLCLDPTSKSSA